MDTVTAITCGLAAHRLQQPAAAVPHLRPGAQGPGTDLRGRFCGTLPRHVYPVPDYDTTVFRSGWACCDVFGETPLRERLEHIDTLFQRPSARKLASCSPTAWTTAPALRPVRDRAAALRQGIHLSILHLLPDAEEYDEITAIYHCMAAASRSTVYHLSEEGDIVPSRRSSSPCPPRMPPIQLCADLDADGRSPAAAARASWAASPRQPALETGQHLGPGRQRPRDRGGLPHPAHPWQCKWGQRPEGLTAHFPHRHLLHPARVRATPLVSSPNPAVQAVIDRCHRPGRGRA